MKPSKTVRVKTSAGGYRQDVSTGWNTKLTKRQAKRTHYLPASQLLREVEEGYRHFWSKRNPPSP